MLSLMTDYKDWMKSYVGLHGVHRRRTHFLPAQPTHFVCPKTSAARPLKPAICWRHTIIRVMCSTQETIRKDYPFTNRFPGIAGRKLTSIKNPVKTVLVTEQPVLAPYSWHQPQKLVAKQYRFNDARNMVSFVDSHVSYVKIYWDSNTTPGHFLRPLALRSASAGYDYKMERRLRR